MRQKRYEWNLRVLMSAYEANGFTDRKWDGAARETLKEFSMDVSFPASNDFTGVIASNCNKAIQAGCQDPMLEYLQVRYTPNDAQESEWFCRAYLKAASDLQTTTYPSLRKFYAWIRTANLVNETYGYGTNVPEEFRAVPVWDSAVAELTKAIEEISTPPDEIYDACHLFMQAWYTRQEAYRGWYPTFEQTYAPAWPGSAKVWLVRGEVSINKAWSARGDGYANTVTPEGWQGFATNMNEAELALNKAWELDPSDPQVPLQMLSVELGQGKGRDRMELWFNRAMNLAPDFLAACKSKLFYLEPKWYGSPEDMLDFGYQCVESTNWTGRVPLILVDAHEAMARYLEGDEKNNYWKQPQVWPDIQLAFDRFFELNPLATGWYNNYAWYAWHCQQWQSLLTIIPKLGPVNYRYFGGTQAFASMIEEAHRHVGETNSALDPEAMAPRRLQTKFTARLHRGCTNETDYTDLLLQTDAFLTAHKGQTNESIDALLGLKVQLYLELLNNPTAARTVAQQAKRDFPQTKLGRSSDRLLALIDKRETTRDLQATLVPGKAFPDFDERDLAGKPIGPAYHKGNILLIDFWATWCGPCVAELPNVLKTYSRHHDAGFDIIGVSLDQDRAKLDTFLKQRSIPWEQYFDGEGWDNKLASKYGVESIPATFLLDRNGVIIGRDLHGDELEAAVAKALGN